jgi:ferredoxin-type protein NapH
VSLFRKYRFIMGRRLVQLTTMSLFIAGSRLGWTLLRGNLSTSKVADAIPLADPFAVLQIGATGRTVGSEALLGAVIVTLFFGLIAGRAFCSWVCPMNLVTDAAGWLRKKTGIRESGSAGLRRSARYWVMGLAVALSPLTGVAAFEWISPVSLLHRGLIYGMGVGWTAVAGVFVFDLIVLKNGFCGHLCPLGGFYSLVGRYSLVRVGHDKEMCSLCMRCVDVCPERQVLSMVGRSTLLVGSGECTNCGRCTEVCEERAMAFTNRFSFKKSQL